HRLPLDLPKRAFHDHISPAGKTIELELRERSHAAEHEKTHQDMEAGKAQIDLFQPVNLWRTESLVHSRSHQTSTGIINSDKINARSPPAPRGRSPHPAQSCLPASPPWERCR